jgi:transmembrane sensor
MGLLNDEIDRVAAEWAAKVATGELTPDERELLDSWRAADIRHVGAFARAQAILLRLGRLRAVNADSLRSSISQMLLNPDDGSIEAPVAADAELPPARTELQSGIAVPMIADRLSGLTEKPNWTRRRIMMVGCAAASIATCGVLVERFHNPAPAGGYSTRVGETREVRLEDGSVVTLNTDSKVSVSYTDTVRRVRLEKGEALFQVAKNKHRPFIVMASDTEVKAVGTSFIVRFLPERPIQIVVKEGVVEVARHGIRRTKTVRAVAETQAFVSPVAPIVVHRIPHPQIAREMAWQFGRIAMENETLADAAADFARYSDTKIVVDPAVSGRTITGLFASNDPVGFAKVAAAVLDLRVEVEPSEVRIVR